MDDLAGLPESVRKQASPGTLSVTPTLHRVKQTVTLGGERRGNSVSYGPAVGLPIPAFWLGALTRKKRTDVGERRAISVQIKREIEGLTLQKPPFIDGDGISSGMSVCP